MAKNNIQYEEIKIVEENNLEYIRNKFPLMKTVPIILEGERLIGGYDKLVECINSNENFGKTLLFG